LTAIAELNDHADRSLLIVEDDKPFLERLSRAMETRGFTVTSCDSVSDGLAQIGRAAPAFAVVDLRLGDGNGLDVVSALKRKRPDARAIVLTGYGNIATAVTAVKMGAVDYLAKPADADDVVAALLSTAKPGAFLINTSRGQLINETDLASALQKGVIAGAALDVLSTEPPPVNHPLSDLSNCIITPHMAWLSQEARKRIMETTLENVRLALAGKPRHVVNR